jgi:uncharacterized membrane protein
MYNTFINNNDVLRWYHTLQGDNSLKSVERFDLFNFRIFLAVCLNISTVINTKILANFNQQTQSYKFTSHIAAFLSVVLITEMLEICIIKQADQILPKVYGTTLNLAKIGQCKYELL